MPLAYVPFATIGLLFLPNLFMTFAWYGHLKYKSAPLVLVIVVSWGPLRWNHAVGFALIVAVAFFIFKEW